jgi:fructuronate reductase
MRAVPVLLAERSAGRTGAGAARVIAAWVDFLVQQHEDGNKPDDADADHLLATLKRSGEDLTKALVATLNTDLGADTAVVDLVHRLRGSW